MRIRVAVALSVFLVGSILCPAPVTADDFQNRVQQHRQQFEQRKAEMLRKFHEQQGSTGTTSTYGGHGTTGTTSTYGGNHSTFPTAGGTSKFPPSDNMKGTSFDPLPFDGKKAPTPDLCFLKFVQAANAASRMEDLMSYIPFAEQRVLKECEQQYDPKLAAEKRAKYQQKGMDASGIAHLTQSPYIGKLKFLRGIAAKVMRVQKFEYKAYNKAQLDVATESMLTVNGVQYPYGTATVEMLGEGDYWRFHSYNDENAHYKVPQ